MWATIRLGLGCMLALVASSVCAATVTPTSASTATPVPEPTVPFGRVVYRAGRVAGFESLGVTMIACRHRDPEPRRFTVQFFDPKGRPVSMLGVGRVTPPLPAGKKVLFVTDGMYFAHRADVTNVVLGHLPMGTARIVSDAVIVRCIGKVRLDAGARSPSWRDEIGLVRAGVPFPALPPQWSLSPYTPRRR